MEETLLDKIAVTRSVNGDGRVNITIYFDSSEMPIRGEYMESCNAFVDSYRQDGLYRYPIYNQLHRNVYNP